MRVKSLQKLIDKLRKKNKHLEKTSTELKHLEIMDAYLANWMHYSSHLPKNSLEFGGEIEECKYIKDENDKKYWTILKEIIKRRVGKEQSDFKDIWQNFIVKNHDELIEATLSDNDEKAIELLNNQFENKLSLGFEITNIESFITPAIKKSLHMFYLSTMLDFAEYLGIIPVENFEQRVYGEYLLKDPDEIIDLIEKKIDLKIEFPKFKKGIYSIHTQRGNFTNRDFYYLYLALKIKELCADKKSPRICEIGGGIGYLAYYLDAVGIKDITIVDIPTTSNVSAYFLMKNLPEREFLFDEEALCLDPEKIKLMVPEFFDQISENSFDLILNCDSFPEINQDIVLSYLNKIPNIADIFYSVNQEAKATMWDLDDAYQNSVPELIQSINKNKNKKYFQRVSRNLFWLRRGYVEELYKIKDVK